MFLQEHFSIGTWAVRLSLIVKSVAVGTLLRFDVRLHFSRCWLLWSSASGLMFLQEHCFTGREGEIPSRDMENCSCRNIWCAVWMQEPRNVPAGTLWKTY